MSDSPASVVRGFLSSFEEWPNLDSTLRFFAQDAVYVDGPRGVHRGIDAITAELEAQAAMGFGDLTIEVRSLVANGGTVMLERVDSLTVGGTPLSIEIMAAFEIDADGRIQRWRESYDFKSVADQLATAGFRAPS
jgi:limonene-1,2-epoxide hydrolase